MNKPIIISGIQPSGHLHIGNYLGALKNFVDLQNSNKYQPLFFIADYHSLTEDYDIKEKSAQVLDLAASYLSAGLNPKKSTLFIQSHVNTHADLAWIFATITPMGELSRMTQFKDKSESGNINAGLFTYPVLMAADILIYDASVVPVGDDQSQHLELTRIIARKFNSRFGQTFTEPKALLTEAPRIMSLDDPTKKMSKSKPAGCLFLDDAPEVIERKVMSATTDSDSAVRFDVEAKPGISNLLQILSSLSNIPISELEAQFSNKNYGEFKSTLANKITEHFKDFREEKARLLKHPNKLLKIFAAGEKLANKITAKKLAEVKSRIGLL